MHCLRHRSCKFNTCSTCSVLSTTECFNHGHYQAPSFPDQTADKSRRGGAKSSESFTNRLRGFTRPIEPRRAVNEESAKHTSESKDTPHESSSCRNQCYKEDQHPSYITTKEWRTADREAVQAAYDLSLRDACVVAELVGRPCTEVHKYMTFMRPGPYATAAEDKLAKGSAKFDQYKAHLHETAPQPIPCYHPGLSCPKAGQKCSCTRTKMYCNEGCPCPCPCDCNRRYPGCDCGGGCARAGVPDPVTALRKCLHKKGGTKTA